VRVRDTICRLPMTLVQYLMTKNVPENEAMDLSKYPTAEELMNEIHIMILEEKIKLILD